jgi:putative ABC transport system permease protein
VKPSGLALLCWRTSIRPRLLDPRGLLAGILSIALGVSVFLAVVIANRGATESFRNAFAAVTGRADLEIRGRISETVLPDVLKTTGVETASPLIEGTVVLPDYPGETLRMAGIDPFTAAGILGFDPPTGSENGALDLATWLAGNDQIAVTAEFLTTHGVARGGKLRLQGSGAPRTMTMGAVISGAAVPENVAATDIATAQEWIGRPGELSAILIKLKPGTDRTEVAAALRRLVPGDVSVEPPSRRTGRVETMIAAFRLNLTAMSLVALLVGVFFVGNAAAASVVRQRVQIGILRAVGVSGRGITTQVLAEACLTGLAGSLAGWVLSPVLAGILAAPVARTVSSLYLPVEARGGWPSPWEAVAGVTVGIAAALVAAWIPARQAARLDPTRVLHPGTAPEIFPVHPWVWARWGMVLLAAAFGSSVAVLQGAPAWLGFGAAFLVMVGGCLITPAVMAMVARIGRPRTPVAALALEQSLRSMHRTAPTAAALGAAAAMTVGIGVMIHSFRGSVVEWVGRTLAADLFIAPAANETTGLEHLLPDSTVAWWKERPEVESVGSFRELETRTLSGESVTIGLVQGPARGRVDFLGGESAARQAELDAGGCTALSESLARRLHLARGDELVLEGPKGAVHLRVIGLYRDYTRDRGIAMVNAANFRKSWDAPGEHSLAVKFRPGVSAAQQAVVRGEFLKAFGGGEAFVCYGNAALKDRIISIFNQTFAVTAVLRSIAIAVAVGGVVLTLGILVVERGRDLAVLRSIGASRHQIAGMMLVEAGFLGLVASIVGLISGTALALVLTFVINRAFFGWTIDLAFPWGEMASLPLWMVGTALVAGLVPALRAVQVAPAVALRAE